MTPSDFGSLYLSKRRTLRPELSGHSGPARVRVTNDDLLTAMYWDGDISDIHYSVGMSWAKDWWQAGLAGVPAQNMESGGQSGYRNYIPYGVSAMLRLQKAADHIKDIVGRGAMVVMQALMEPPGDFKPDKKAVVSCLAALEKFYSGYSPSKAVLAAITPQ